MSVSKFSLFEDYRTWVLKHSEILSQVETLGRLTSYLIAGRIGRSPAISEFLYSATNIIVLMNDQILLSASSHPLRLHQWPTLLEHFHILLTIIDYLQVFLEITALKVWGARGKWITIMIIQIAKFLWRALLLIQQQSGLSASRPVPPLNRKNIAEHLSVMNGNTSGSMRSTKQDERSPALAFTLKSGRVIRTVNAAPHLQNRTWKPPTLQESNHIPRVTKLKGYPLMGEVIYTAKPLFHLAAMSRWGSSAWFPWFLALGMDLTSLSFLKVEESSPLNAEDKKEIQRRQLTLLMYLLRSPLYDRFSRRILSAVLTKLSRLPLIGILPQHVLQYLPYWQQLYSYTWD